MKLHRLTGMIAAAVLLGALAAVALVVPLAAQQGRNGQLHIVKDCAAESGIPGSDFCTIVTSNLPELPAGTQIYYDLIAALTAGPGYFDQNIFVFVNTSQWAVGRCTGPNDINTPGQRGYARYPMGSAGSPDSPLASTLRTGPEATVLCLPGMERIASIPCREDKPGLTESGCGKDSAAWRRDRRRTHRA